MYITVDELVLNLSISINSFFKVLRNCGYSKSMFFHLDDLKKLRDCLKSANKDHYKKKIVNKTD